MQGMIPPAWSSLFLVEYNQSLHLKIATMKARIVPIV